MFSKSILNCCSSFVSLLVLACCLSACGGGGGGNDKPSAAVSVDDLRDIEAYVSDATYSQQLKPCVLNATEGSYCLLLDLPLLVEEASQPDIASIMGRVLVSDPWMGQRFQQVLETLPSELLALFSAITTIVIDDDVRPSYFSAGSSTIFIDPAYLWLLSSEKSTISLKPDYRSDFADELAFVSLARYVDGFENAWFYYSLTDNEERSLDDIRLRLARLLLHELAHANDFFPPDQAPYLKQNQTVYQAYQLLNTTAIYRQLYAQEPLSSQTMFGLAKVMYRGQPANEAQQQLTALEVGEALAQDAASDDYGYTSATEDVAMLFEEAMMKYLFNVDRDIAYIQRPETGTFCEVAVDWGQRGRLGDTGVKQRAQWVVEAIYPDQDFSLFFQDLPLPLSMREGESWCDNLALF
jgi:hypothetical protein